MRRPASRSGWRAFGEPFSRKSLHSLEELAAPPRDRTRTAAAAEGCSSDGNGPGEAESHHQAAIEIGPRQVNCDLVSPLLSMVCAVAAGAPERTPGGRVRRSQHRSRWRNPRRTRVKTEQRHRPHPRGLLPRAPVRPRRACSPQTRQGLDEVVVAVDETGIDGLAFGKVAHSVQQDGRAGGPGGEVGRRGELVEHALCGLQVAVAIRQVDEPAQLDQRGGDGGGCGGVFVLWYGSGPRSLLEMSRQSPSHCSQNRWPRAMWATATFGPASMETDASQEPLGFTTSLA